VLFCFRVCIHSCIWAVAISRLAATQVRYRFITYKLRNHQIYVIFSALPPVMVPRTVGKVPTEPPLIDDYSNVVPANTNFPTSPVNFAFPLSGQCEIFLAFHCLFVSECWTEHECILLTSLRNLTSCWLQNYLHVKYKLVFSVSVVTLVSVVKLVTTTCGIYFLCSVVIYYVILNHFYRTMLCIRGTSHGPVSVCLCLSITSQSSTKMAKQRITQTTPHQGL